MVAAACAAAWWSAGPVGAETSFEPADSLSAEADAPLRLPPSSGTRVPIIRVAVSTRAPAIEVGSSFGAWVGRHRSGQRPSRIESGERWRLEAEGDGVVLRDGVGRARGSTNDTLYVFPVDRESGFLTVEGREYRGELLVWRGTDGLTVVNAIDLESYLRGVVPLEMGPQPAQTVEALKAQAVAARSYTLATMGRWRADGFDLLATVEDQVYGGAAKEKAVCSDAIEETRGVVLSFQHFPVRAFYSSTCGGTTAGPDEVWNRPRVEYLESVPDRTKRVSEPFCGISPRFDWSEEWSGAELDRILERTLKRRDSGWSRARYGRLTGISIEARGPSRRVSDLRLAFEKGHVDIGGDEIRWVLRKTNGEGLRSALLTKVQVTKKKGRVAHVRISGRGYGHGVGLCQFGAMGMAKTGYDHTQILRFYYRGASLVRAY